jgi:hypothetical protein
MIEILLKWRVAIMMYHDLGEVKAVSGAEIRMIEHACKQLAAAASTHAAKLDPEVRVTVLVGGRMLSGYWSTVLVVGRNAA